MCNGGLRAGGDGIQVGMQAQSSIRRNRARQPPRLGNALASLVANWTSACAGGWLVVMQPQVIQHQCLELYADVMY